MKKFTLLFLIFTLSILPNKSKTFPEKQNEAKKLSFISHWLPQAQFAGYYAAYENGFYKKYGIELEMLVGGPSHPSTEALKNGKADFASLWLANAIQLRAAGVRIVNIAQIINKSALIFVAKKTSGIKEPKDFDKRKVGLWGGDFNLQPMAFFEKYKVNVRVIPQASSINLFLRNGVDVTSAMWYNEYHSIINSGYDPEDLVTFFFADYGLNFPEEGLYVTEEFYNKNQKIIESFVKASIEGWLWAFKNKKEAVDLVSKYMKKHKVPCNIAHQMWMLSRFEDLILGKNKKIEVTLNEKDFNFVGEQLKAAGLIKNAPKYSDFYKPVIK